MAALRSTSFYQGTPPVVGGVNTWALAYTVPAGKRIILKSVHTYQNGAVTHSWGVRIDGALMVGQASLAPGASHEETMWVVLNAGQTLQVEQVVGSLITYLLSGYLLFV